MKSGLSNIPEDRWPIALAAALMQTTPPEVLVAMVAAGESEFLRVAAMTDMMGFRKQDYAAAFQHIKNTVEQATLASKRH